MNVVMIILVQKQCLLFLANCLSSENVVVLGCHAVQTRRQIPCSRKLYRLHLHPRTSNLSRTYHTLHKSLQNCVPVYFGLPNIHVFRGVILGYDAVQTLNIYQIFGKNTVFILRMNSRQFISEKLIYMPTYESTRRHNSGQHRHPHSHVNLTLCV